jgi:hypothetical protein
VTSIHSFITFGGLPLIFKTEKRSSGDVDDDTSVFVYTGEGGAIAPQIVVRVMVDPSVRSIPANAFCQRKKLTEVELCEGLVEIGERSFAGCGHSIKIINIPNSLRRVRDNAFYRSL